MSTEMPLISVYIPTKNRFTLLQRALQSVEQQTYKNIEIIVVDDGSTDASAAFLAEQMAHGALKYIRNEHSAGASAARNQAIFSANGEFITGLDDDDELKPEHIETLYTAFRSFNGAGVTVSQRVRTTRGDEKVRNRDAGTYSLTRLLHRNALGNQVFTRTTYLRKIGGFDACMPSFQDYDTWVRLIQHYGPVKKLRVASYILHQDHLGDRISNDAERRMSGWQRFNDKHAHLMSTSHRRSQQMIKMSIQPANVGGIAMLKNINRHNWRIAAATLRDLWLKN